MCPVNIFNQHESYQLTSSQGWIAKVEQINSLAPLPEDPATAQLTEMLVPAPYEAPEKKGKKKGKDPKGGPHRRGLSDTVSGEIEIISYHEGDDDEEEEEEAESDSPRKWRRKKRTAFKNLEGAAPKRGKITLSASSDSEA